MRDIEDIVRECVGWPYVTGGRGSDGIDCFGLILYILNELGLPIPDFPYSDTAEGQILFLSNFHRFGRRVSIANLKSGDVMLFKGDSGVLNHLGVAFGRGKFIHAVVSCGVIVSKVEDKVWKRKFHSCYRYSKE